MSDRLPKNFESETPLTYYTFERIMASFNHYFRISTFFEKILTDQAALRKSLSNLFFQSFIHISGGEN